MSYKLLLQNKMDDIINNLELLYIDNNNKNYLSKQLDCEVFNNS
jgi:hypothetical protein